MNNGDATSKGIAKKGQEPQEPLFSDHLNKIAGIKTYIQIHNATKGKSQAVKIYIQIHTTTKGKL